MSKELAKNMAKQVADLAERLAQEVQTSEKTPSHIALKNGRDSDATYHNNLNVDTQYGTRVGDVYNILSSFTNTPIVGVHDHKGNLTIVWGERPSLIDLHYAARVWETFGECNIAHVYVYDTVIKPVHLGMYMEEADLDFIFKDFTDKEWLKQITG